MRARLLTLVTVTLVLGVPAPGGYAAPAPKAPASGARCFRMFDGTAYAHKPDLAPFGLEPARLFDPDRLWPGLDKAAELPEKSVYRSWVASIRTRPGHLIIDIEHWPLRGTDATVTESVSRYVTVVTAVRKEGYTDPLGYYGAPPVQDYWRAIEPPESREYREWQAENDRLRPLADVVDVLFPSLYAFYDDVPGWERYAIANLAEARRLAAGKPVYAFLMPQYHDSNRLLGSRYVAEAFWSRQLHLVLQYADGAVIWGGWGGEDLHSNRPQEWHEDAPWWQVTRNFLATHTICGAPASGRR